MNQLKSADCLASGDYSVAGGGLASGDYLVRVSNQQSGWNVAERLLGDLARQVLAAERAPGNSEMSLIFVGLSEMTELNRTFMGVDKATDVLAFPVDDRWQSHDGQPTSLPTDQPAGQPAGLPNSLPPETAPHRLLIGDVVVCPEIARRNAASSKPYETPQSPSFRHPTLDDTSAEIALLVVHGTLHLCGYDHASTQERELMFELQQTYLANYFNSQPELPAGFNSAIDLEP